MEQIKLKKKIFYKAKRILDFLFSTGIGLSLGLLIWNFRFTEVTVLQKVLSIFSFCITVVSYSTRNIISIFERKREKALRSAFFDYKLKKMIYKNEKVRTLYDARVIKIIALTDFIESKISIKLSALNCDIDQCFIDTQFAQPLLKEIEVGDSVSVALNGNNVMAILILDGVFSRFIVIDNSIEDKVVVVNTFKNYNKVVGQHI